MKSIEDLNLIKADFIITHINKTFHLWQSVPWGRDISFDDFCEYILPYRLDNEPLLKIMNDNYYFPIDSIAVQLKYYNISMDEFLFNYMWQLLPQSRRELELPNPVQNNYIADCIWDSYRVLSECRSTCIPVAIDFTPAWPSRNGRHYWNTIVDPCLVKKTFSENLVNNYAKVYRKTYSHNKMPANNGVDFIPIIFRSPFNKDVTDVYNKTVDLDITINNEINDNIDNSYLCVFNDLVWNPVAWGERVKNNRFIFHKMGVNCVYLPVYYSKNEEISGGYPILVDALKRIHEIIPSKVRKRPMTLTRKYPVNSMAYGLNDALLNLTVECSLFSDFSSSTVSKIDKIKSIPFQEIKINRVSRYNYLQISPNSLEGKIQIAEICFFDRNNKQIECNLSDFIVSSCERDVKKMFDSDALTYYVMRAPLIFKINKLPPISKIRITPRNDDNYINIGDMYELYYREKSGWLSVGKKMATDYFISFDSVPTDALYWLHNHTKGTEERIFTIENGNVRFW